MQIWGGRRKSVRWETLGSSVWFFLVPGQVPVCLEKYGESEIIPLQEIRPNGLK